MRERGDASRGRYGRGPILERSDDLLSRILADWDASTASRARTSSTPRRITSAIRSAVFRRGRFLGVSADTQDVVLDAITQHVAR